MKHPASRDVFAYWDLCRGTAIAPTRADFDPAALRAHLGDMFVVGFGERGSDAFRVAGTRVCARFGRELKGLAFRTLWHARDRHLVDDIADSVAFEHQASIIGAVGHDSAGLQTSFELLLLPFKDGTLARPSFTGLMAPLTASAPFKNGRIVELAVTSWRRVEGIVPPPARDVAPTRRHPLRGFTLYEVGRREFDARKRPPTTFR